MAGDGGFSLALVIVFLAVLYGLFRLLSRRRPQGPRRPGLTMEQAWDRWVNRIQDLPYGDRQIVEELKSRLAESAIENLKKELFEIEKKAKEAEDPLVPLRTALMDALDTSLLNQALGNLSVQTKTILRTHLGELYTDEVFQWGYLTRGFMCGILRWYSSLKYDDAGEDDWFTYYAKIANQRTKKVVEILRCLESGEWEKAGIQGLVKKAYAEQVAGQFEQSLVKAPKKTPILRPAEKPAEEGPNRWTW